MSEYTPDAWVLLEFTSPQYGKITKVLAGWYGGYCGSDEWKLSSGNLQSFEEGEYIVFPQESGSLYRCHKDSERMTALTSSIFIRFEKQLSELPNASIKIVEYASYI